MYDAMNESSVPCKRVCVEDDEDGYEDDDIVAVVDASPPMKRERAKKNTPNTLRGIAKRFIDLLRDNADITIGQAALDLDVSRRRLYDAINPLAAAGLLAVQRNHVQLIEQSPCENIVIDEREQRIARFLHSQNSALRDVELKLDAAMDVLETVTEHLFTSVHLYTHKNDTIQLMCNSDDVQQQSLYVGGAGTLIRVDEPYKSANTRTGRTYPLYLHANASDVANERMHVKRLLSTSNTPICSTTGIKLELDNAADVEPFE